MKITVFGANSATGKQLVHQAIAKGMAVTAFDRQIDYFIDLDNRSDELKAMKGYVFDESDVKKAIKDAGAVVSLIGGGKDGNDKSRSLGTRNIIKQMEATGVKRLIVLAGTAILDADGSHMLMDTPDFPPEEMPLALEYLAMLRLLQSSTLDWTVFCAPAITEEEGKQQYITRADHIPGPGKTHIPAGDLADAILNEIPASRYLHRRVGIAEPGEWEQ